MIERSEQKMQNKVKTSSSNKLKGKALDSKSSSQGPLDTRIDEDEDARFDKSLQELKNLPCQLRYAADYCEKSFMQAKQKKTVLENTKEYVCRALVTVVDHLGTISANLQFQLSENKDISSSELRLDCLKQRLLTCQDYSQKLTLSKVCWNENFPRYNKHYVSPYNSVDSKTISSCTLDTKEEGLLQVKAYRHKRLLSKLPDKKLSSVIPACHNPFVASIPREVVFQFLEAKKHGHHERSRRLLQIPWRNKGRV